MKKRKIVLILFLILFLCVGCNAEYSIKINDDLSVRENLTAKKTKEFYDQYSNRMVGEVVASILNPYIDILNDNNYYTDTVINPNDAGITTHKDYKSIDEYIRNTIFKSQYTTDDINYSLDGYVVTLSVTGGLSTDEQNQSVIPITTATISINLPFKVLDHNADYVSGNNYYWTFDKDTKAPKTIKISFHSNEFAEDTPKTGIDKIKEKIADNKYLFFIIVGVAILSISGIVIGYRKLKEKQEKVNKI